MARLICLGEIEARQFASKLGSEPFQLCWIISRIAIAERARAACGSAKHLLRVLYGAGDCCSVRAVISRDNKSFGNSKRLLESPVRLNSRQHREPRSWFCGAHTMDCVDGQPTMSKTADESCRQEQAPRLATDGFDGEMANPNPFTGY